MGEPEDLIIDGAYRASRLARDVWRRYAPPAAENVLHLKDVRVRIELFLHALIGSPLRVVSADTPAPVSWLARLAGRAPDNPDVLAGSDGERVYLPPALDATGGWDDALRLYLLLAVQQAVRIVRGSTMLALDIEDREVRDRFMLADAVAVDDWIAREAPGLVPVLRTARRDSLARRGSAWPSRPRERAGEALVRNFLAHDPRKRFPDVPADVSVSDALRWAGALSASGPADSYRAIPPAWYWGRALATSSARQVTAFRDHDNEPAQTVTRRRVAEMRRRPRRREADDDEDDSGAGTWVVRTDEPQETVEDPFGLQRPTDRADEADPEGLGDSLAELPEARVVRTPGQAKEVLRAGDEPPPAAGRQATSRPERVGIAYPEWDFRSGTYRRPGAIVREMAPAVGDSGWVESALGRHGTLVRRVRTRFERLRPRRTLIGRQIDGPELDIAEYVTAAADARAGGVAEDRLYIAVRPGRRELTVALLVDVSASTDSWVSQHQRIIDVEKEALLVVCEALGALGDPYAILTFSGESAEHVSVVAVKHFTERADDTVRRRIAALDADGYTRVGAALRHTTAVLSRQPTARRLLLMLSDGKPNDVDEYDGPYGIEDTRQAVAEARAQNVEVFCLTVDREAPRYAPRIFGRSGFTLLRRPNQLPEVLIEVLRRLVRA